jgi:hypothetical protein
LMKALMAFMRYRLLSVVEDNCSLSVLRGG